MKLSIMTFRYIILAAMVITAGQAWADGTIAIGTTEGGSLDCYSDAACISTTKITSAEPGSTVYVRAVADGIHTLVGMTASNISVEETSGSGAAEARSVTRAPGIGKAVAVSAVSGKQDLYSFTMPSDGWNVCVKATFPAKTKANVSYIDIDGQTKQTEAYVLDGTEEVLGEPGGSSSYPKETWYVCNTNLSYTTINFCSNCNVNIILADNVEMSVINSNGDAISNSYDSQDSFGVYGQSKGSDRGALTARTTSSGGYAINITGGVIISHCKLTAEGVSYGIRTYGSGKDVTISGAEVNATATSGQAIWSYGGGVTITGGTVTAEGVSYGIRAEGSSRDVTISDAEVNATATGTLGYAICSYGGGVSITGSTVIAVGDNYGIRAYGSGKDVTISDAEVTANATGTSGNAIWSDYGGVSITGGTVIAEGGSYGIRANGSGKDVTISNAEVTANATNGYAIWSEYGGVSITGGTVIAEGSSYGINANGTGKDVTISDAKVTANATGTYGYAIYSNYGGVSITGGTVTAEGVSYGIRADGSGKDVTISGAEVTATATNDYAICSYGGGVTITGGNVTANGTKGIFSSGNIILSWTSATDFICANGYSVDYDKAVKTADGKRFVVYNMANADDISATTIVSGTVTDLSAIAGKTLKPLDGYYVATVNSHVIFDGKTDTDGKIKPDFSIDGTHYYTYNENETVTLSGGEDGVKVDVSGLPDGTTYDADNSSFNMPGEDVTLTLSRYMANVDYMDWDATGAQLVKKNTGSDNNTANNKVYILDGYKKTIGQDKKETWYVCNTPASSNSGKGLEYSSATISNFAGISLEGNVHLILANGSKMTVSIEDSDVGSAAIEGHAGGYTIQGQGVAIGGFTIHGQGGTTEGILDINATNSVDKAIGISYNYEDINICGGTINIVAHATGDRSYALGIYVEFGDLNIYGGTVNVRSWDDKKAESCGLLAYYNIEYGGGNVNILGGTVNVITSDNAYTENTTTYAIYAEVGNVTISNATVTTHSLYVIEDNGVTTIVTHRGPRYGIYAESGSLNDRGKVIITGDANIDAVGNTGIGAKKLVQINSGTVSATRISSGGNIEINGGQVDSHTTVFNMEWINSYETIDPDNTDERLHYPGDAIHADGSIILGWTVATDYVRAYRISTGPAGDEESAVVKTAADKRFVAYNVNDSDPNNPVETPAAYLAGNTALTDAELDNLNAPVCYKVFRPLASTVLSVPGNVSVVGKNADFSITTGEDELAVTTRYYLYNAAAQSPVTVTASYDGEGFAKLGGLPEGTTLDDVENQPMQRSFAMPAQDVALTATAVTGLTASGTYTYSGSAQTPAINLGESAFEATNYTVTGITPKEGSNSQLTDGSAVNAGEYSLAITGLGQYIGTASVDFTIGKADYEGTTTASAKVVCNQVTTGKMLTLPALPDGASYAATGIVGGETVALIEGTPTVSGTTLTFSTTSQVDGTSATITIGVTGATNYNDYDVVVTVTAQAKEETVITINESITKTYGDADFTLSPSVLADAGSGVWTWASANTDVATISENGTVTILKAGEATIKVVFESETHLGEASVKLTVNPKTLGIVWNTDGLVYDGTPKAPTAHLSGVKSGDDCSVEISVEGDHAKAGAGYTATASLSGTKAGNYTLPEDKKSNAFTISPKPVTVSSTGITAENKIYDGKTSATLSGSFAFDDGTIIAGDNVTITGGTGAFADKNVGTGKTVVISGVTLGGTDAGNYTLSAQPTGVTGSITKKTVTVTSGISASNKTYDGTTTATLSGTNAVISGKVDGDDLSVSATGAFADKDAGTGKTVKISSITLTGNDKDNYVLASTGNQATTSANISKKDLNITADDKNVSYGDPAPNYTASYSGFVSDESKSNLSGSLSFSCSYMSSSNTGTYSIMPSGYTSSNYNISYNNGTLTVIAADVDYTGGTITFDENGYDITLDEGTGSANPLPNGIIDDLDYSRTLAAPGSSNGDVKIGNEAANLYTVCLPAAPTTGTAAKYYTLNSVKGNTLKFTEIDGSPAAFTPYLVAVKGSCDFIVSCSNVSFDTENEIYGSTVDGFTFTGTLTGLSNADAIAAASSGNVTYILQNAAIWGKVVSGSVYLPPFRAFIVGPVLAAGARELSSSFDDGNATAIERIVTTDRDGTEHWYDMNGRRIEKPTTKGVYILNGRKEVIK